MTAANRITAYATPLCETVVEVPEPHGTEVLVRISRCGVCHSDLHLQDGYFSLGGDKKLDVTRRPRTLPFTLGHEIAGVVETAGPDAGRRELGQRRSRSFPGSAAASARPAARGEENLCAAPRHLGIQVDGGFATHVLVPHPRYLLDYAPLPPALAGAYMCSGLTAYSALKRIAEHARARPGAAGRARRRRHDGAGVRARAVSRMRRSSPTSIRPSARRRSKAGAAAAYDPADQDARKALVKADRRRRRRGRFRRLRRLAGLRGRRARQGRQGGDHRAARRHLHDAGRDVPAAR